MTSISPVSIFEHQVGDSNERITADFNFEPLFSGQNIILITEAGESLEIFKASVVIFLRHAFGERGEGVLKRLIISFLILGRHKKVGELALRPFFQNFMTVRTVFGEGVILIGDAIDILEFISQRTLFKGCQTGKRPLGFGRNSGITSMDMV